jgi:hypothetical protein
VSTPNPEQPAPRTTVPKARPLWFYWAFGGLWELIGIGDLIAQRANLFGLGPVGIGVVIWVIGLVAARRRSTERQRATEDD